MPLVQGEGGQRGTQSQIVVTDPVVERAAHAASGAIAHAYVIEVHVDLEL